MDTIDKSVRNDDDDDCNDASIFRDTQWISVKFAWITEVKIIYKQR